MKTTTQEERDELRACWVNNDVLDRVLAEREAALEDVARERERAERAERECDTWRRELNTVRTALAESRAREERLREEIAGHFHPICCPLCGEMTDEPISYWRHHDHPKGKCTETFYGPPLREELVAALAPAPASREGETKTGDELAREHGFEPRAASGGEALGHDIGHVDASREGETSEGAQQMKICPHGKIPGLSEPCIECAADWERRSASWNAARGRDPSGGEQFPNCDDGKCGRDECRTCRSVGGCLYDAPAPAQAPDPSGGEGAMCECGDLFTSRKDYETHRKLAHPEDDAPAQAPDDAERLELIRSWWVRDHHMAWPGDTWGDVQSLAALLRARDEATIERCAEKADYIAELMESGAGELRPGERLRQVAGLIRALKKPGGG